MKLDRITSPQSQVSENSVTTENTTVNTTSRARAIALKTLLCVGSIFGVVAGGALSAAGLVGVVVLTGLAVGATGLSIVHIWAALLAASVTLGGGLVFLGAKILAEDKSGTLALGVGVVIVPLALGAFALPFALPIAAAGVAVAPGLLVGGGSIALTVFGWKKIS